MDWARQEERLPAHFHILRLAVGQYRSDPRVTGIFLGGSFARGGYDRFSDIDLHIVVSDEHRAALIAERPVLMRGLGGVLCEWSTRGDHQLLCLYDTGVTLEVDLHSLDYLERPRHAFKLLILHDPNGRLAAFAADCERTPLTPEVDADRLLQLWQMVWAWLFLGTGQTLRGEVWEGRDYLEVLRVNAVLPVYRTLHQQPAIGYRRIEGWADAEFLRRLEGTVAPLERSAVLQGLLTMVDLFLDLATDLAHRYGTALPQQPTEVRHWVEALAGPAHPPAP